MRPAFVACENLLEAFEEPAIRHVQPVGPAKRTQKERRVSGVEGRDDTIYGRGRGMGNERTCTGRCRSTLSFFRNSDSARHRRNLRTGPRWGSVDASRWDQRVLVEANLGVRACRLPFVRMESPIRSCNEGTENMEMISTTFRSQIGNSSGEHSGANLAVNVEHSPAVINGYGLAPIEPRTETTDVGVDERQVPPDKEQKLH